MKTISTQKIPGNYSVWTIRLWFIATSKSIAVLIVVCIFSVVHSYAQAPNISYSSPQVFHPFIPLSPVTPVNAGGIVPLPNPMLSNASMSVVSMAIDNANFYLFGYGSHSVTKISGGVSTQLGTGLDNPSGMAVDAAGDVFVADIYHNAIKEIVASSGATNTLLSVTSPKGMAIDAAGTIYFCIGTSVYKLPAGASSRIAVATGFTTPASVAVDGAGNVYVGDQGPGAIIKVLASNHTKVTLTSGIKNLNNVAVDKYGNAYCAATAQPIMVIPGVGGPLLPVCASFPNHRTLAIDKNANVYTDVSGGNIARVPFGAYTISPALPVGLSFDNTTGTISGNPLLLTPAANYTVTAYNNQGKSATTVNIAVSADQKPNISYNTPQYITVNTPVSYSVTNTGGAAPTQHQYQLELVAGTKFSGMAVDASGNIYAATHSTTVVKYPPGGGAALKTYTGFVNTVGVVLDAAGNIFVLDNSKKEVDEILASNGSVVTYATGFLFPQAIAIDAAGNLYITDSSRKCVYKVPAGGGTPVMLVKGLSQPIGVAADPTGNVYYADKTANTVSELLVSTSSPIVLASGLNGPTSIAADPGGNVFLLSSGGNTGVQRITAGGGMPVPVALDIPPVSQGSIALDAKGIIYVSDWNSGALGEINPGYYVNPNLPAGLSIDQSTGVISGTPTTTSPKTNYSVSARNSGGVSVATIEITVSQPPPPAISYTSPQTYAENNAINPLAPVTNMKYAPKNFSTVNPTTFASGFNNGAIATDVAGNVYYIDTPNGAIYKIPAAGGAAIPIGGGQAYNAVAIVLDAAGNIYYVSGSTAVYIIRPDGSTAPIKAGFINLISIGIDAANNLYVLDGGPQNVIEIPAGNGTPVVLYTYSSGNGNPKAITADRNGNVYVAMFVGSAIDPIYKIGSGGQLAYLGATNASNPFMTTDQGGNLYFLNGNAIYEIAPTLLAHPIYSSSGNLYPAVDGAGNLFVSNASNGTIIKSTRQTGFYIKGILPSGLAFDNTTGIISGTPAAVSPATDYTITGYTATASAAATVNITTVAGTNTSLTGLAVSSGTLSPAFATATTNYTVSLPNSTSSVKVTPTAAGGTAVIRVNGILVASGAASSAIPLSVGANAIGVSVTDNGGTTASNYTITVSRAGDPSLAGLAVNSGTLSPTFAPGTYSYSVTMPAGVGSISITPTLTDTTGTISINQKEVATGTASPNIQLALGSNNISVVTQTTDGLSSTYTINAIRLSSNANLSAVSFSKGTVSPAFSANTLSYTVAVANAVTSITVTPTTSDAYAAVKVNGTTVTSGTPSAAIPLSAGANTVTVAITAPDGSVTKTYTFTVNRAKSTNANLAGLIISKGTLTPAFAPATTSYTASVANSVTGITVKATVAESTATIKINGTAVASGAVSPNIPLAVGSNTINTVVTAGDGTTTKTYTVTVSRAAGPINIPDESVAVASPIEKPSIEDDVIVVHQGISPNGDGINDFLVIDGIQAYPDNKLMIMNRNGALVFETKGYDNASKVFDGRSNKTGQMQLPGTYFYSLEYTAKGINKHKTGYLVLKY